MKRGVDFTKFLQEDFTSPDPKSVNIQSGYQYLLALLGFLWVKAVRKMLVKLTPDDVWVYILLFVE